MTTLITWKACNLFSTIYPVDKVYSSMPAETIELALLAVIKRRNIPLEILSPGWHELDASEQARLRIFAPRQNRHDINERSLAVYAGFGAEGVLLTGDMGPAGLRQLKKAGMPGPSSLLKLPHHGSRASLPAHFLAYLSPSLPLSRPAGITPTACLTLPRSACAKSWPSRSAEQTCRGL